MQDRLAEKKLQVPNDFNGVARWYDLLTGMNPGYDKHLRWSAEHLGAGRDDRILDLCCGTGRSTLALRAVYSSARIDALDASEGMLTKARRREDLRDVNWVLGDAMHPHAAGCAGPYGAILMAYGIRNVPDPDLCLTRLHDLLEPGGTLCIHEYSVQDSAIARWVWNLVATTVIIPAGMVTSPGSDIYRYLRRSVNEFDGRATLEERLRRAGFIDVHTREVDGWQYGIVHSFMARRGT